MSVYNSSQPESHLDLDSILRTHCLLQHPQQSPALFEDECTNTLISVRRNHIWHDSLLQFTKRFFDTKRPVEVIFHGEEGVDGGGPCREYFRLLCADIKEKSRLFTSHASKQLVKFNSNASLVMKQHFYLAGLMVGTSLINGGPGFRFLPECVYQYIVQQSMDVDPHAHDVVDDHVQEMLHRV